MQCNPPRSPRPFCRWEHFTRTHWTCDKSALGIPQIFHLLQGVIQIDECIPLIWVQSSLTPPLYNHSALFWVDGIAEASSPSFLRQAVEVVGGGLKRTPDDLKFKYKYKHKYKCEYTILDIKTHVLSLLFWCKPYKKEEGCSRPQMTSNTNTNTNT